MKRTIGFLAGFIVAITVGVAAQDSVIPSRLKLQALRVGTGAVPAAGNASVTGTLTTGATTTTGTATAGGFVATAGGETLRSIGNTSFFSWYNAANSTRAGFIRCRTDTQDCEWSNDLRGITISIGASGLTGNGAGLTSLSGANISTGTTGSGNIVRATSPALTTPTVGGQQVCVANGTNCPADPTNTMAAAVISGIGSCSISTGALRVSSCTRTSAGVYNVNFSVSIGANNPACVATVNNNAGAVRSITVQTFNGMRKDVRIVDGAGTATDANFEILCVAT